MNGLETATVVWGTAVEPEQYLEITGVYPPPEAEEGDWVYIQVFVRNNHPADIVARLKATIDGINVESPPATLKAGTDYSWGVHFTMPNKSVSGTVALERRELTQWFVEDTAGIREIALKEPEEPEVPPRGIPWWGWAILGGVGIAGGALAYRFISPLLPKKKEE